MSTAKEILECTQENVGNALTKLDKLKKVTTEYNEILELLDSANDLLHVKIINSQGE